MSVQSTTRNLLVLQYDYCEGAEQKRAPFQAAHIAHSNAYRKRGILRFGGAFLPATGALFVFEGATVEQVQSFVREDPYVLNKVGLFSRCCSSTLLFRSW